MIVVVDHYDGSDDGNIDCDVTNDDCDDSYVGYLHFEFRKSHFHASSLLR
jgi:hypothetical protein